MAVSSPTPGSAIAAAAARRGWESDELADRIQVNRTMVAAWVDGSAEPPDRFHRRLIEALEFTNDELAALTGELPAVLTTADPTPESTPAPSEAPRQPDGESEPELVPEIPPPTTPAPSPTPDPAPRRQSTISAGRAIQEARRRKGWTTRELASAIHYERDEVKAWEDDISAPWKFAARSMLAVLDFTDDEAKAVERSIGG